MDTDTAGSCWGKIMGKTDDNQDRLLNVLSEAHEGCY